MDKGVVEKCLAFCQSLSNNHQLFSFSLTIGSDNFNFDLKELAKSSCVKKKKSPSQLRREERRREERKQAATKAEEDAAKVSEKTLVKPKCDPCETTFNSEEELSAHNESAHKKLSSPEKEHGIPSHCELRMSPIHVQRDEENLSENESASSPLPSPPSLSLVCELSWPGYCDSKCGKTFSCENDLRVHVHLSHNLCFRQRYLTPCPWEHCISHDKS